MVLLLSAVLLALVVAKTLSLSALLVPLFAGMWLAQPQRAAVGLAAPLRQCRRAPVLVMFVAVSRRGARRARRRHRHRAAW